MDLVLNLFLKMSSQRHYTEESNHQNHSYDEYYIRLLDQIKSLILIDKEISKRQIKESSIHYEE